MNLGIAGKKAVVIGGSSGLGLASCEALAAEGVALDIVGRDLGRLEGVCADLSARHCIVARPRALDVTSAAEVWTLAERLKADGGLDILVLNTPRPPSPMRDFLDETDDARWHDAARDQLDSALFVLRALVPVMLGKNWGRIVAITSASVKQPLPRHALSTVYRAGVQAALKHLADEVAPHGITVNSVAPATIMTPTFGLYHNVEARVAAVPLGRAGKPEELAGTVAFLASQQAGFLTGQVLQIDGGQTRSLY